MDSIMTNSWRPSRCSVKGEITKELSIRSSPGKCRDRYFVGDPVYYINNLSNPKSVCWNLSGSPKS